MLAEVGSILVGLALAVAVYASLATLLAIHSADPRWAKSGRNGVYAAAAILGLALLALLGAFLGDEFQIRYVALHSSRDLPLYLKTSAVWAGQEGSLLLWSFLQALFAALVVGFPTERTRNLVPWASVFLNILTAFFSAVTLFLSNPFARQAAIPPDGFGLNPLLRHTGMIFHPPAMYLGYVGLAVPFAFALAALVTRTVDGWPSAARRWTLVAWLFLGLGLMLGARWAYDVLGWGGYWGWDPVENAGLMPWLTATALLHGTAMQEQHRGFRWWNFLLATFSFVLVLFGTFTTRSGLIQSVHAFVHSNLGPYFLAAIALVLVGSLALMVNRRSILTASVPLEGLLSRDGMFVLTMLLLLSLTVSVLIGSVLPTLTEALVGRRFEAGPAWFDRVTGPQFAALALVMGICPLVWRAITLQKGHSDGTLSTLQKGHSDGTRPVDLRRVRKRGWPALLGAGMVTIVAVLVGFSRPISLVSFAIVGLAGGTAVGEIGRDFARGRPREESGGLGALWRSVGRNRRRSGGYLVHLGVVLVGLGIIGTRLHALEAEVALSPDESVAVGGYTLVYEDLRQESVGDRRTTWASISVYRNGRNGTYLATLKPQMDQYANFEQTIAVPALRMGLREDLYLVLFWWSEDGLLRVKVIVNPLVNFLWLGGLVLLVGGALALWPPAQTVCLPMKREGRPPSTARPTVRSRLRRRRQKGLLPASRARQRAVRTAVGLVAGLLVLIAAAVMMWRPGEGFVVQPLGWQPAGRLISGQPAPDFTLRLLDGSTLTLADLRGRVVVLNFWATWCSPCEKEMPALQAAWAGYQAQGLIVVGVAVQEGEAEVREMAARFGVDFPLGMDPGEHIAAAYGITGVPETFVIDPEGRVAHVHIGPVGASELNRELRSLLER